MNLDLTLGAVGCDTAEEGENGAFASSSHHHAAEGPRDVEVSKYMGTVMANGDFGSLRVLEGSEEVEYEAVQVHLVAPSLHAVNHQTYDAEMMVMHKPRGASDMLDKSLIVSVFFSASADGEFSAIFESMGFAAGNHSGSASWKSRGAIDFGAPLTAALQGPSYLYNGSVPVPPCSESVKWVVLGTPQAASTKQTEALRTLLSGVRGGVSHRQPIERAHDRCVAVNSRQIGGGHRQPTCEADLKAGTWQRSAECWEAQDKCWAKRYSSVDIRTADAMQPDEQHPLQDVYNIVQWKPVENHVKVTSSLYSLDAFVGGQNRHFGQILANGHVFFAKNVSFKAISQHTVDGQRSEGELVIEHVMYGDIFPERLPEENLHRIMVSIPLKIGGENSLLRKLGLRASTSRSIRDGDSYEVTTSIDLLRELKESLDGRWFWYSSNSTHRDCGNSVRWMVFETPLSISLEQLNLLTVPVSGVDSSHTPYPVPVGSFFRQHLPVSAVEANETDCENLRDPNWKYGDHSPHWDYGNERCWGLEHPICSVGQRQSPIDIPTSGFKEGKDNFLNKCSWKPVEGLRVSNTGHGVQVSSDQFGYMQFMNDQGFPDFYQVVQFHVHMPAEHLVGGHQHAAELHIVHKKQNTVLDLANDDLLVTAIFFDIGEEDNPILRQLFLPNGTTQLHAEGSHKAMAHPFDPLWAFGPVIDGPFYRYDGSLTTPPCAEVVKWFVFEKAMHMSKQQWVAFKALYPNPGNNRPVRALNGRPVAHNSFEEGTAVEHRYFLNREMGHDRMAVSPSWYILFPIGGTILLMCTVMAATFVRQSRVWQASSAGGMQATTIGAQQSTAAYSPL